jgi:hypothetical protein
MIALNPPTPLEAQIKATDEAAIVLLIHLTTDQIKLAKKAYNAPGGRTDWKTYQHLPRLKRQATMLCAAQAIRHGRVHCKAMDWDAQVGIVSEALPHILAEAFPKAA